MATGNEKLEAGLLAWKKQKSKEGLNYALLSAAGIITLLAVWQLVVSLGLVNERMLPAPTQIFETLMYKFANKAPDGNVLWVNILASLQVALSGFLAAIIIGVPLELVMGWLINQPDPTTGEYPFWDNSQLPGNVFGQAWLVNDFFIGLAAMIYVWVIFPLVCEGFSRLSPKAANVAFALIIIGFAACVTASYLELKLWEKY